MAKLVPKSGLGVQEVPKPGLGAQEMTKPVPKPGLGVQEVPKLVSKPVLGMQEVPASGSWILSGVDFPLVKNNRLEVSVVPPSARRGERLPRVKGAVISITPRCKTQPGPDRGQKRARGWRQRAGTAPGRFAAPRAPLWVL